MSQRKRKTKPNPKAKPILAFIAGVGAGALGVHLYQKLSRRNLDVVSQMKENIFRDSADVRVQLILKEILKGSEPSDTIDRASRIYGWLKAKLEWKPDPASRDRAAPLLETLEVGAGDCDCLVTAFCTLAEAAGHKVSIMVAPGHVVALLPVSPGWAEKATVETIVHEGERRFLPFDLSHHRVGSLIPVTAADLQDGKCTVVETLDNAP